MASNTHLRTFTIFSLTRLGSYYWIKISAKNSNGISFSKPVAAMQASVPDTPSSYLFSDSLVTLSA